MKFTRRPDRVPADCSDRLRGCTSRAPSSWVPSWTGSPHSAAARSIWNPRSPRPPALRPVDRHQPGHYVFYDAATTALHRDHIVLHEVGHMLSGHSNLLSGEVAQTLVPDLDPGSVESVLGRSHYSDQDEQEAEMIASLILRRADRTPARRPATSQQAEVLSRMDDVFGSPKRRQN